MIIPFIILLIFSPVIIRQSEKCGLDELAMVLSYVGYTWMGLLVLFCTISMPIDLWMLIIKRIRRLLRKGSDFLVIPEKFSFILSTLFSIVITVYGYYEAQTISIERHEIRSSKIAERIRIVQISDMHIGFIIRDERVRRIVELVKSERPDIVVSTGDLVDAQIDNLEGISFIFQEVRPRYGKFAITGNHEFYAGLDQAIEFIEKSGFRVLRGEGITVANILNIAGVDDPAGKAYGLYVEVAEKDLLSRLPHGRFTILLKHRPLIKRESVEFFDLQLSGHTHKGQFFPVSILTWLYYPNHAGMLRLTHSSYLYVSRGAGTWGPPIRFLSPPEITVIELIPYRER